MPDFMTPTGDRVSLTKGDRLCIQRRRLGETQRQAALRHRVTYHIYSAWENDLPAPARCPAVAVGAIKPHERALVYRRHTKRTQAEVAEALGVCVFTLRKMERGERPCEDLLAYWEN